jgi:putative tricarboxylic transport membrane protein
MTERFADTLSGIFLLVLAVVAGALASSFPTTLTDQYAGPSFMPVLLSICLAASAAAVVVKAQIKPSGRRVQGWSDTDFAGAIHIGVVVAATAAYNLLLQPVGYLLTTALYLMVLLRYMKVSWWLSISLSLVVTILIYAMFTIWLRVILPMGLIEIYF